MQRRALLTSLAALSTAATTGCLGQSGGPGGGPETEPSSPSPTDSPTVTRVPPDGKAIRCRGAPVSVEKTYQDEPGYDDEIEYFPENETVRFVSVRSGDEPVGFETWTFEEWGTIHAAEAALERVREVTAERLGTDSFGSGMGNSPGFFSSSKLVVWLHVATQVSDGEKTQTPRVPLYRLVNVAPKSVETTVSLKGDTYSRTVPIFANHETVGWD